MEGGRRLGLCGLEGGSRVVLRKGSADLGVVWRVVGERRVGGLEGGLRMVLQKNL